MNIEINDREKQTLLVALDLLRDTKQRSVIGTEQERKAFYKINEYDLLAPQHTLMHTLTLLARITQRPVEHFANRNPSQNPPPKTHQDHASTGAGGGDEEF